MSFERAPYGYTLHAESDKLFVMRRQYDEYTGATTDVVEMFKCEPTLTGVKKLTQYFEHIGISVELASDPYHPDVLIVADFDPETRFSVNETANTVTLESAELFVCFGLDDDHEPEAPVLDAGDNADEPYKWYAGF